MGSLPKKEYGVEFVNIELKFKAELYFSKEDVIPNEADLFSWVGDLAKDFYKFGFGYNERTNSYTASVTYRGGKPSELPPCVTQHGSSPLSALRKLYVVLELCGGKLEGFKFASDSVQQLESYIEDAVKKLL